MVIVLESIKTLIKLKYLIFFFILIGCSNNGVVLPKKDLILENINFDVVEKKLTNQALLPSHLETLLSNWFSKNIKVNGFDGNVEIYINYYSEKISDISDGKRVDTNIKLDVIINKPSLSFKKVIEVEANTFGTLTGNFSLKDFDLIIQNTQSDLVERLTKDIISKI